MVLVLNLDSIKYDDHRTCFSLKSGFTKIWLTPKTLLPFNFHTTSLYILSTDSVWGLTWFPFKSDMRGKVTPWWRMARERMVNMLLTVNKVFSIIKFSFKLCVVLFFQPLYINRKEMEWNGNKYTFQMHLHCLATELGTTQSPSRQSTAFGRSAGTVWTANIS